MGDWLIVGITDDPCVAKGPGRPMIPARERARALRALRCVDEVVIDTNATPEAIIAFWRPAIFVKGADYAGQPIPEQAWVARYGGEVRFTNGDTMYHSRQWLNGDARARMAQQGVRVADLLEVLNLAGDYRIHVVGDLIVDACIDGELIGPLTLQVGQDEGWVGGAGAVALHAAGAGAQVHLSCPIDDGAVAQCAMVFFSQAPSLVLHPVASPRDVPSKLRFYSDRGLLCQIDYVDSSPYPPEVTEGLAACLRKWPTEAVIFADYRHGVFHADSIAALTAAIPANALRVADSQVASRWGNILDFESFDLVTPNEREARWALGWQDRSAADVMGALHIQGNFQYVLLTRAADGLMGIDADSAEVTIPALATQAVDPVGAGDALLAYATLGLLASESLVTAAWLGSVAAAIACSRRGNAPVTADEVRAWLERL